MSLDISHKPHQPAPCVGESLYSQDKKEKGEISMYIDRFGIFWEDEEVRKLPEHKIKDLEIHETALEGEDLFD